MVLKILMLNKISLKSVCVLFVVLALEFLLMPTRTTLSSEWGCRSQGIKWIQAPGLLQERANSTIPELRQQTQ